MDSSNTTEKNTTKQPHPLRNLVIVLFCLSICLIIARTIFQDADAFPVGESLWQINYIVEITNPEPHAYAYIPIPNETNYIRIIKQGFNHPGISLKRSSRAKRVGSYLRAEFHHKGQYKLALDFLIHVGEDYRLQKRAKASRTLKSNDHIQKYLANNLPINIQHQWIEKTKVKLNQLAKDKTDYVIKANHLVRGLIHSPTQSKRITLNAYERALLVTVLCRANQIPARVITGIELQESIDSKLHYWVQTYDDDKWLAFDPSYGFDNEMPRNYLPLKFNHRLFIESSGDQRFSFSIDISAVHNTTGLISPNQRSVWQIFDLTRLSKESQEDLAKLLLLPFAVLLTALIRRLLGIRSYGTFTPALLALSLTYLGWGIALFLFSLVTIIAFMGRRFLPNSMSRVPRLSIVFTLVALALGLGFSILDYIDLITIGQGVLLPIVILTSLVDRLYTAWDVEGKTIATIRLAWTIAIAAACIPVVNFSWLGFQALIYPEIHFSTIAAILIIYAYKGPTVSERYPIPWLFESAKSKKSAQSATDNG